MDRSTSVRRIGKPRLLAIFVGLIVGLAACGPPLPQPGPDWGFFGVVAEVEFLEPLVESDLLWPGGIDSDYLSGALVFRLTTGELIEVAAGTPGGNNCRDLSLRGAKKRECVVAGAYGPDGEAAWFEVLEPSDVKPARGGGRQVATIGVTSEDDESVVVRSIRMDKHPSYEVICEPADTAEDIVARGLPATANIELSTLSVLHVSCIQND